MLPENAPTAPATKGTAEDEEPAMVRLAAALQFDGMAIELGESAPALNPAPDTDNTDSVAVPLFLKTLVPEPCLLTPISTVLIVVVPTQTLPKFKALATMGVTPSPSITVLSASAQGRN